jgi:phosphatidylserine decarboxylase
MLLSLVVILGCAVALFLWGWHFPDPSPLIRLLLPAKRRWPEVQIRGWLTAGRIPEGFRRFFERDPERRVPPVPGLIAPADGLVTSAQVRDVTRYVVIALSFWDVHVQRSPCDGVVESIEDSGDTYMDGEGRDFAFLREKICPVQKRIIIRMQRGVVAVRLITSLSARRLQVWVSPGDEVTRGQRLGRILLGSTVVLEMPKAWDYALNERQRVWAGETPVETRGAGEGT